MTSSIGLAASAAPFKPQVFPVNNLISGSTSGVGGMSAQSFGRYQPEPTHHFTYHPGSSRFKVPGRGNLQQAAGTWGNGVVSKFNMVKQTNGLSGYLNQKPISRLKKTQMVLANLGKTPVNPNLPRGGSIMRVVGTEQNEDPNTFKDNFNFGNFEDGNGFSGNDMQAPLPDNLTREIRRQIIKADEPILGGGGMGGGIGSSRYSGGINHSIINQADFGEALTEAQKAAYLQMNRRNSAMTNDSSFYNNPLTDDQGNIQQLPGVSKNYVEDNSDVIAQGHTSQVVVTLLRANAYLPAQLSQNPKFIKDYTNALDNAQYREAANLLQEEFPKEFEGTSTDVIIDAIIRIITG